MRLNCKLRSKIPYETPENFMLGSMHLLSTADTLKEISFSANLAGFKMFSEYGTKGLSLSYTGYSDSEKLAKYIDITTKTLSNPEITEERFKELQKASLDANKNWKTWPAYRQGAYWTRLLISKSYAFSPI